jgi:hypothetical protein
LGGIILPLGVSRRAVCGAGFGKLLRHVCRSLANR